MSCQVDWPALEARAKSMTVNGLLWAIWDCRETARVMGNADMLGKDASYYLDELSVYHRELVSRRPRREIR